VHAEPGCAQVRITREMVTGGVPDPGWKMTRTRTR
jgi:hypothetical protein